MLKRGCIENAAVGVTIALVMFGSAQGAEPSVAYFAGAARETNLFTGQTTEQAIVLQRTTNSATATITEIACLKSPSRPAQQSSIYMKIDGDKMRVSNSPAFDEAASVSGTGTVRGEMWNWTYLTFDIRFKQGAMQVRIEDANFLVNGKLIARKQLFLPDGTPVQLWEANLDPVSAGSFLAQSRDMGCPAG